MFSPVRLSANESSLADSRYERIFVAENRDHAGVLAKFSDQPLSQAIQNGAGRAWSGWSRPTRSDVRWRDLSSSSCALPRSWRFPRPDGTRDRSPSPASAAPESGCHGG